MLDVRPDEQKITDLAARRRYHFRFHLLDKGGWYQLVFFLGTSSNACSLSRLRARSHAETDLESPLALRIGGIFDVHLRA